MLLRFGIVLMLILPNIWIIMTNIILFHFSYLEIIDLTSRFILFTHSIADISDEVLNFNLKNKVI